MQPLPEKIRRKISERAAKSDNLFYLFALAILLGTTNIIFGAPSIINQPHLAYADVPPAPPAPPPPAPPPPAPPPPAPPQTCLDEWGQVIPCAEDLLVGGSSSGSGSGGSCGL